MLPEEFKDINLKNKNFFDFLFPFSRICLFFFYLYEKISLKPLNTETVTKKK